jgi:ADP-ribose pyrophosphatase YjhB (NUDIX family)
MDKITCKNCGKIGHIYKNCKYPILSYGLVLFNEKNEILMIERKNCITYIEFLRGKYTLENLDYLKLLFNRMSKSEKDKIRNNNFKYLWDDLWLFKEKVHKNVLNEYERSEKKFNKLNNGIIINDELINLEYLLKTNTNYNENEWELPKGRRNINEKDIDTSVREVKEETNISESDYEINTNIKFEETFKGINNVTYKHIYYLARLNKDIKLEINKDNKDQLIEVNNLKMFNKLDCLNKVRKYNKHKINLLNKVFFFLERNEK